MAKHARASSDDVDPIPAAGGRVNSQDLSSGDPEDAGRHAANFSYKGDTQSVYPDALDSLEPVDRPPLFYYEDPIVVEPVEASGHHNKGNQDVAGGKRKKQGSGPELSPRQRRSRRMRKILIFLIALAVVIFIALVYMSVQWVLEGQNVAEQLVEEQTLEDVESLSEDISDDSGTTEKLVEVPDLASLLGLTQDEALAELGDGASVTATSAVAEEGSSIATSLTVDLGDDAGAGSDSEAPTVYLGLDANGLVVQAGYSASITLLGYGSLSFSDAVEEEHIIEQTLAEAGISVEEGSVSLPEDRATYTTYDEDGTTVLRENCSFSGTAEIDGVEHAWSAKLLYDYTTSNVTGDLEDTVCCVYVYLNA